MKKLMLWLLATVLKAFPGTRDVTPETAWPTLKADLLRLETWLKSLGAVAIGGAINAAIDYYRSGQQFTLSVEHLAELKARAISGAVVGLIFYWFTNSPWGKNKPSSP